MGFGTKGEAAGLHLMKYRWAIYKSIQGVPIKVNEFKIEITLVILGLRDQLYINGKRRHLSNFA